MKTSVFRIFFFCALALCAVPLVAQNQGIRNMPYIDQRRIHYGFALGVNMPDITFQNTGWVQPSGASWFAECDALNPSFCVGLMGDLALTEHINLRTTPMLYFQNRSVTFRDPNNDVSVKQNLKTAYIELPATVKISTHRLNNYRPYFSGGISAYYDLSHEKESPIVFNHFDFGLHIAIGCDNYLPFFKFIPELRFSLGLVDMLDHKRSSLKDPEMLQYTQAIGRARNKSLSLIFYFE